MEGRGRLGRVISTEAILKAVGFDENTSGKGVEREQQGTENRFLRDANRHRQREI